MNKKYWQAHVDHVVKDGSKTVLELFLDKNKKIKPKGRGFIPISEQSDSLASENVHHLRRALAENFKAQAGNKKKEKVMDDNSDLAKIDQMIEKIITRTRGMSKKLDKWLIGLDALPPDVAREKKLFTLGMAFLDAEEYVNLPLAEIFMEEGFNPNFQHPTKKLTALHMAAGTTFTAFTDMLIDSGKCDYSLRDSRGYLAYDLAYRFGKCSEITYELKEKTQEQAKERGVNIKLFSALDM